MNVLLQNIVWIEHFETYVLKLILKISRKLVDPNRIEKLYFQILGYAISKS